MMKLLRALILMGLSMACGQGFDQDEPESTRQQEAQEVDTYSINQEYLGLLNDDRVTLGLRPLIYNSIIENFAKEHSKGMANGGRSYGHLGLNKRCRKIGRKLTPTKSCSEIISRSGKTTSELLKIWKSSSDDLKELHSLAFTHTALGIYKDPNGVIYWTQIFVEL